MKLESREEPVILECDTKIYSKNDNSKMHKATNASTSNKVPPFVALHIWKKL